MKTFPPPLSVTLVQSELHWHNIDANLAMFEEKIWEIGKRTDLIVLPEMFTTGFTMDAPGQAETMDGETVRWLADTASAAGAAICGSLIIERDGHYFNRFVLMQADGKHTVYDKRHLFRLAGEGDHYSAGRDLVTAQINDWNVRPMVCYDLRFPVWSRRRNNDNFDLLLYVANWPSPRHHAWQTLLRARAIENQCFVAGVNIIGTDGNGVQYAGGSAIIDYLGQDLADLGAEAGSASATLDLATLQTFRNKFPFAVDADGYRIDVDA
jgi:predicted amidohydrolase